MKGLVWRMTEGISSSLLPSVNENQSHSRLIWTLSQGHRLWIRILIMNCRNVTVCELFLAEGESLRRVKSLRAAWVIWDEIRQESDKRTDWLCWSMKDKHPYKCCMWSKKHLKLSLTPTDHALFKVTHRWEAHFTGIYQNTQHFRFEEEHCLA